MQQVLIHQNFLKKVDLASLISNVTTNVNNLKSKVDKFDVDKLAPNPADLSNLKDVV